MVARLPLPNLHEIAIQPRRIHGHANLLQVFDFLSVVYLIFLFLRLRGVASAVFAKLATAALCCCDTAGG